MNKMIVLTKSDQVDGFRLAGVDAIGVDDVETLENMITSWLSKKEEVLLALDDGLFSLLDKDLIKRIYDSNEMLLVTIPDKPVSGGEKTRKQQIFDMIRHATGVQIRFKGEGNGT
jgi:vacuolar-type H+-ATPase subunit F/Vma7